MESWKHPEIFLAKYFCKAWECFFLFYQLCSAASEPVQKCKCQEAATKSFQTSVAENLYGIKLDFCRE